MTPGELVDLIEARTWANQTVKAERKRKPDARSAAEKQRELEQLKQEFGKT